MQEKWSDHNPPTVAWISAQGEHKTPLETILGFSTLIQNNSNYQSLYKTPNIHKKSFRNLSSDLTEQNLHFFDIFNLYTLTSFSPHFKQVKLEKRDCTKLAKFLIGFPKLFSFLDWDIGKGSKVTWQVGLKAIALHVHVFFF